MRCAIETENLTKVFWFWKGWRRFFQPLTAVDHVSLKVPEGQIFVLLGPNGAGKTTLIKLLCGLIFPSQGEGKIFGVSLKENRILKAQMGLVLSDERSFYGRLSAVENLVFYAKLYRLPQRVIRPRIEKLLDQWGLNGQASAPVQTYSSGMKHRLSIARALLHDPPLLFLDEPTKSLDPFAAGEFRSFLKDELVGRRRKTLFIATHQLEEAEKMAGDVAVMAGGRIMASGTLPDISRKYHSVEKFLNSSVGDSYSSRILTTPSAGYE